LNRRNIVRMTIRGVLLFGAGLVVGFLTAPKTGRGARSWLRQNFDHRAHQVREIGTILRRRASYEEGRLTGAMHRIRQLRAVPDESKYVDDDLITQRVRTELGENRLTSAIPRINVDTADRIVTLRGVVHADRDKQNLERVCAMVEDVEGVVNKVNVLAEKAGEA
jgi:osmotically-inducible protein OsmY